MVRGMPMKSRETKKQFIQLRAEGLSFEEISKRLDISKSTCSNWNVQFRIEILERQKDTYDELYRQYGMVKQAKIRSLGKILRKIDTAMDEIDFSEMTPSQLLDARLKYQQALQKEYSPKADTEEVKDAEMFL